MKASHGWLGKSNKYLRFIIISLSVWDWERTKTLAVEKIVCWEGITGSCKDVLRGKEFNWN